MRLLGILASLLALFFYLAKIIRFLSGKNAKTSNAGKKDSVDSRLRRAKPANVIEVKTVSSPKPGES